MRVDILKCLAITVVLVGATPRSAPAAGLVGFAPTVSAQSDTLTAQALRQLRRIERAATREITTPRSRYRSPDIRGLRAMIPEYVALVDQLLDHYSSEMGQADPAHVERAAELRRELARLSSMEASRVPGVIRGHASRLRGFIREHRGLVEALQA